MPHCIIDYSQDVAAQLDIDTLIEAVHLGAMDSGLFPEYDIKTRAIEFAQHRTGQTRDSFVHVAVHLLDGRSDEQKAGLSEAVLARIERVAKFSALTGAHHHAARRGWRHRLQLPQQVPALLQIQAEIMIIRLQLLLVRA